MFVMLDVAIGLVFTYLLLSLLCTAINEWIASWRGMRARTLVKAIARLANPDGPETLDAAKPILEQPEVRALSPRIDRPPSYIPKAVFLRAVSKAKVAVQRSEEEWALMFDASMDRATGWFKRRMQVISLLVAIGLTLLANADTLHMVNGLWRSPTVRARFLEAARARVSDQPTQTFAEHYRNPDVPTLSEDGDAVENAEEVPADVPAPTQEEEELLAGVMGWRTDFATFNQAVCDDYEARRETLCSAPGRDADCAKLLDRIAKDPRVRLEGAALVPTSEWPRAAFFRPRLLVISLFHLPGWLFTIAAITIGAPFWFDLLSRFVNIRGTGKPPEQNPKNEAAR